MTTIPLHPKAVKQAIEAHAKAPRIRDGVNRGVPAAITAYLNALIKEGVATTDQVVDPRETGSVIVTRLIITLEDSNETA